MNLSAAIANSLWTASNVPALIHFRHALNRPAETQLQLLRNYLVRNADSAYGKAHAFRDISNYHEFAQRVPLTHYDDIEPWIERIRRGEKKVLTSDVVTHLIPTSGSTGARKLIPFTAGLQREFNRAISPWIANLYSRHPSVALGTAYWSVSPALQAKDAGPSAVPIGFEDDSSYLGGAQKRFVDYVMAVPSELRLVSDMEQFRYLTLLCLLRQHDLRLISIWHPSYLSLLLDALPDCWDHLLDDIRTGGCRYSESLPPTVLGGLKLRPMPRRAKELNGTKPETPNTIWPRLKIVSCWGDANASYGIAELQRRLPYTLIQPKGLIATEAIATIPFSDSRPLAVCSHFFEFIDAQSRVRLTHELQQNGIYEIVVTNSGGLWRYRLKDQVRVTSFIGKTPSLSFLGKIGNLSDRFGEKLSEHFVAQAIQKAIAGLATLPRFALLAPDDDESGCRYTLYAEGKIQSDLALRLEAILQENLQYAWCRKLGQLKSLRLFQINSGGYEAFVAHELSHGMRLGEIKPRSLSLKNGWTRIFSGNYLVFES